MELIKTMHAQQLTLVSVTPWLGRPLLHAPFWAKHSSPFHHSTARHVWHQTRIDTDLEPHSSKPWLFSLNVFAFIHLPTKLLMLLGCNKGDNKCQQNDQPLFCDSCILSTLEYQSVTNETTFYSTLLNVTNLYQKGIWRWTCLIFCTAQGLTDYEVLVHERWCWNNTILGKKCAQKGI